MTIGDRIKEKRKELHLSQEALAKLAGYSDKSAISKFEHSGDDISMKQVKRVAQALGVSSAYLMGWEREDRILKLFSNAPPTLQETLVQILEAAQPKP